MPAQAGNLAVVGPQQTNSVHAHEPYCDSNTPDTLLLASLAFIGPAAIALARCCCSACTAICVDKLPAFTDAAAAAFCLSYTCAHAKKHVAPFTMKPSRRSQPYYSISHHCRTFGTTKPCNAPLSHWIWSDHTCKSINTVPYLCESCVHIPLLLPLPPPCMLLPWLCGCRRRRCCHLAVANCPPLHLLVEQSEKDCTAAAVCCLCLLQQPLLGLHV